MGLHRFLTGNGSLTLTGLIYDQARSEDATGPFRSNISPKILKVKFHQKWNALGKNSSAIKTKNNTKIPYRSLKTGSVSS